MLMNLFENLCFVNDEMKNLMSLLDENWGFISLLLEKII